MAVDADRGAEMQSQGFVHAIQDFKSLIKFNSQASRVSGTSVFGLCEWLVVAASAIFVTATEAEQHYATAPGTFSPSLSLSTICSQL